MMQKWLSKEAANKGAKLEAISNKTIDKSSSKTPTLDKNKAQLAMAANANSSDNSSKKSGSHFSLSLEQAMNDSSVRVFKDDDFVCIKDKYPKAKHHFLLIPLLKINGKYLSSVSELLQLPKANEMLQKLRNLSTKIAEGFNTKTGKALKFNVGFHSIQSMYPLHMHIISNDMNSDCLKNKKHYNSFTTDYFLSLDKLMGSFSKADSAAVISEFNLGNKLKVEAYLKQDMVCHHCQAPQTNIPNLKKHLLTHVQ